ncbi:hypothetical protein ZHAS_00006490 [Anopheles sinensis]|uniref:Uncharacterized protein n=1 Tax=Anopheles sinensis TaxID=74873 RepID=A0A084VMG1_ANOSI|nr:hypothetical protein ZHAS_00006490 [Anopheles sinensis]
MPFPSPIVGPLPSDPKANRNTVRFFAVPSLQAGQGWICDFTKGSEFCASLSRRRSRLPQQTTAQIRGSTGFWAENHEIKPFPIEHRMRYRLINRPPGFAEWRKVIVDPTDSGLGMAGIRNEQQEAPFESAGAWIMGKNKTRQNGDGMENRFWEKFRTTKGKGRNMVQKWESQECGQNETDFTTQKNHLT